MTYSVPSGVYSQPLTRLLESLEVSNDLELITSSSQQHWHTITILVTEDNRYEVDLVKEWLNQLNNITPSSIKGRIHKESGQYLVSRIKMDSITLSMIIPQAGFYPNPTIFRDLNSVDQLGYTIQISDPDRGSPAAELMRESIFQRRLSKHPKRNEYTYPRKEWLSLMELVNPNKASNLKGKIDSDIPFIKCPLYGYDIAAVCSTLGIDQIIIPVSQGFLLAVGVMPPKKAKRHATPVYQLVVNAEGYYALLSHLNEMFIPEQGVNLNNVLIALSNLTNEETTAFTYQTLPVSAEVDFWESYLSHIDRLLVM